MQDPPQGLKSGQESFLTAKTLQVIVMAHRTDGVGDLTTHNSSDFVRFVLAEVCPEWYEVCVGVSV